MLQQITIADDTVFVIQDIATKEGWTFDEAVQRIWDNNATENVRAHKKDMTEKIIRGLSPADMDKLVKDKKL